MIALTGIATAVTHSTVIYGQHDENQLHVTSFVIDGSRRVRIRANRQAMVGEGEQVVVAGVLRGSLLAALAYENLSTHVKGNIGKIDRLLGGLGTLAFAAWGAYGWFAAIAAIAGACGLVAAMRIHLAERELRDEISRAD